MDQTELVALARQYAATVDLYELLQIDSLQAKEPKEVQRAYRKQSIKYHPDKTGDAFDPAKWELLEKCRDVLMDAGAKEAYDSARGAALAREEARRAMDAKKRAMVEDLERRERGEAPKRMRADDAQNGMSETERRRMAERGRQRMEERQRLMREAEERERQAQEVVRPPEKDHQQQEAKVAPTNEDVGPEKPISDRKMGDNYDSEIADLERRLQEARERKAAKKTRKREGKESAGTDDPPPSSKAQAPITKDLPVVTDSKADEKKVFSFSAHSTSPSTPVSTTARPKGDFSSTMARLKAAQAEKERKKAEAEAAAKATS